MKINDVAKKYNITKRSLRYYEEIGLIKSTRIGAANSRYYDDAAINRLEQILLLRSVNFTLNDISHVLLSDNIDSAFKIFINRLDEINDKINELNYFKAIIDSFIKIGRSEGINNINIYQLLKDQIYIHNNDERMINMEKNYDGDIIRIEFGIGIIPLVNPKEGGKLLDEIKNMRKRLELEASKNIPLIRVLDNTELNELEYKISVKGNVMVDNNLVSVKPEDRVLEMIGYLERVLKLNIDSLSKTE